MVYPVASYGRKREMGMRDWYDREGSPSPLGITYIEDEAAYNFALYSKYATAVTLLLFAELDLSIPTYEYRLDPLANKSGRIWHCRLRKKCHSRCPLLRLSGRGTRQSRTGPSLRSSEDPS